MTESLKERFDNIRERISAAAIRVGRDPGEIKLLPVSKTHQVETLREAISVGANSFGENKVQEAEGKIAELGGEGIEWHLIGHLQANKARKAVKSFDVIHSLDSVELADRLERICEEEGRAELPVLIHVDLAGEETKSGIAEKEMPSLVEFLRECTHLKFVGLMLLPPYFDDSEDTRPYFKRLREIRDEVCPGGELSMGMTHDLEIAVEEGATIVRVGTAIFGNR